LSYWHEETRLITFNIEPTPEITAFCFSPEKLSGYLRVKVDRLATQDVFERSKTLLRNLATDGLLEDGHEQLLAGEFTPLEGSQY
jgi:hypothetical protein